MVMSTVRAVGAEVLSPEPKSKMTAAELKSSLRNIRPAYLKKHQPNSAYFKAASSTTNVEKDSFRDFKSILSIPSKSAPVNARETLKATVEKLKHVPSPLNSGVLHIDKIRKAVYAANQTEEKEFTDLQEWQIYHVEKVIEYRKTQKSLPNLNGIKGKGRYAQRSPPVEIEMS